MVCTKGYRGELTLDQNFPIAVKVDFFVWVVPCKHNLLSRRAGKPTYN